MAEPDLLARPGDRQGGRHPPQDGVAQTADAPRRGFDGGTDRRVGRGVEERQLEGPDPQPGPGGVVDPIGIGQEPIDQPVAGPAHPGGAVDEFGRERPIERAAGQHRRQREVGVGALGVDAHERLDGEPTGGDSRRNGSLR